MDKRSESFGRMLRAAMAAVAAIEGKTQQAIEAELGGLIGVAGPTMQRYKAGHVPPDPARVERLADAGVRRGLLSLAWLERFLAAARFPAYDAHALAAQLFPVAPAPQPGASRPNLPPPTYTRFIMRKQAYEAVLAGLISTLPTTMLVSLGGMGKTSLARALAGDCLEGRVPELPVACAIWVSDKDRPGTTNLSSTLSEIARTLDYPGLAGLPFAERLREVEGLLRRQLVLLVIDNGDTITDSALFEWLMRIPPPSRALVTSRFALPALSEAYLVELEPMSEAEIRALINAWLPRSRLRGLSDALEQVLPLAAATGGNPKAAELALGLLQHRTLAEVLADLAGTKALLFEELFARAWDLLDGAARRTLTVLPLFPNSVTAEALAYCADLSTTALQQSVTLLERLSLLDVERTDLRHPPRYNAHTLVRAYAQARLAELSDSVQTQLRERWLAWCNDLAAAVGFCWDDLDRLELLDNEHLAIQAAIRWAATYQRHAVLLSLVEGVRYYNNVRGLWGEDELHNLELRVMVARRLGLQDEELLSLAHQIEILSKQGRTHEAGVLIGRLDELGAEPYRDQITLVETARIGVSRHNDAMFEYGHALALYKRARGELAAAEEHWRQLLVFSQLLGGQKYVVNRRWLATALLEQGRLTEARSIYSSSLVDARRIGDLRSVAGNTLKLAAIDLLDGDLEAAEAALAECEVIARRYRDRRRLAECHVLIAQLKEQRGENEAATKELLAAFDLFERLGMLREAEQTRSAIARYITPRL